MTGPVVLVGERGNAPRELTRRPSTDVRLRLKIGAFREGVSRRRLENLGLKWDHSLNLLPSCPAAEAQWKNESEMEASKVARALTEHFDRATFFLCGSRVSSAFGFAFKPLSVRTQGRHTFALLPHPSGLNRFWNTGSEEAKEFVRSCLHREAGVI